jgi:hypothetical protein
MTKLKAGLLIIGLLAVSILIYVLFLTPEEEVFEFEETDDEIAYVRRYVPSVTVTNVSTDTLVSVGKSLVTGDTLTTNSAGFAMVLFLDETITRVSPSSQLVIRSALNEDRNLNLRTQINLAIGALFMDVNRRNDTEFEVTTTNTVASVKGTRFGISADDYIWVEEGEVEVTIRSTGQVVNLVNRMFLDVDEDGTVESGELSDEELTQLSAEYEILDSDLIEREMRLQFRNRQGDSAEEQLRIFEQEEEN